MYIFTFKTISTWCSSSMLWKFCLFFLFLPHVHLYQHGYTVSMNTYFNPWFYRTKENPIQRTISSFLVLGTPVFFTVTKNQNSGLMICLKYFHLSFGKLLLFCINIFMPTNWSWYVTLQFCTKIKLNFCFPIMHLLNIRCLVSDVFNVIL